MLILLTVNIAATLDVQSFQNGKGGADASPQNCLNGNFLIYNILTLLLDKKLWQHAGSFIICLPTKRQHYIIEPFQHPILQSCA